MIFHQFQYPWVLAGLLVLPLLYLLERKQKLKLIETVSFSSLQNIKTIRTSAITKLRQIIVGFRYICLALIIIALARPQKGTSYSESNDEGIDIVLALDISTSMKAMDFKPKHRLHVAKEVIEDFVQKRVSDRIALVVFAGQSFTQVPLTLDYNILTQFLRKVDFGLVQDGTAIGLALVNAGNRLENSKSKSKIVILLTDGENNSSDISPLTAAKALGALDIKVYTIGVGKGGRQPVEVDHPLFGKQVIQHDFPIDEKTLKEIAKITKAQYYRAHSPKELREIYTTIDKLEKTDIEAIKYTFFSESFANLIWVTLALLLLELILLRTRFIKLP